MPPFLILLIYNLLLPFALLILLPASVLKMRKRGGYGRKFWQRFGWFDQETASALAASAGRCWWLHAVSVGEVNIARKLIAELLARDPARPIVLSVTTSTGYAVATGGAPDGLTVIYSPVDLWWVAGAVLRRIRPRRLVLVEAEVWPNLVSRARRAGVPVALVNARLSPRSERRYRALRALAAPVFGMLDLVLVQESGDVPRWVGIGARPEVVRVAGSIKFDLANPAAAADPRVAEFRSILGTLWPGAPAAPRILLASTHDGEEKALAAALGQELSGRFPGWQLLIAPRHAERRAAVRADLESLGLRVALRSAVTEAPAAPDVLVIDSTGELRAWQELPALVIIGKSFLTTGGQNPVEAIAAGVPVLCGPHMENFAALMDLLLRAGGIRQEPDAAAVARAAGEFLTDPAAARAMATLGRAALTEHHGATARSADLLEGMPDADS